jgi:hypothetical protein
MSTQSADHCKSGPVIGLADPASERDKLIAANYALFVGRRKGDKLASLVNEIEATGSTVFARALDARKEGEIVSFCRMPTSMHRWKSASST